MDHAILSCFGKRLKCVDVLELMVECNGGSLKTYYC